MNESILPGLCGLLFLLVAFRKPIQLACRRMTNEKPASADEQFREIVELERQRLKDETGNRKDATPNPP